jgi:hypothetical protein
MFTQFKQFWEKPSEKGREKGKSQNNSIVMGSHNSWIWIVFFPLSCPDPSQSHGFHFGFHKTLQFERGSWFPSLFLQQLNEDG